MTNPTQSETLLREALTETARLQRELDITNADHVALWIEANTIPDEPMSQCIGWLACRIVEAHEAALQSIPEPLLDEGLVERVARALRAADRHQSDLTWADYEIFARAALAASHGVAGDAALVERVNAALHHLQADGALDRAMLADTLRAALSIPRLEAGRVTGSLTLDNASVQRLMDYGLLHYTDEGWVVSKDIWNASAPDGLPLVERMRPMADALLAVVEATRAYLPPDGIDAQECLNRIIGATDNPEINPIIREIENGR